MTKEEDAKGKKKKKGVRSWLWPRITNMESSIDAAKNAEGAAYWLVFSYAIGIIFLFSTGSTIDGIKPSDDLELYLTAAINIPMLGLALWLGLRIRKEKFSSVPIVAIWIIFEVFLKAFTMPGKGIVLSVLFLIIAIGALRGWFGIRRYQKANN